MFRPLLPSTAFEIFPASEAMRSILMMFAAVFAHSSAAFVQRTAFKYNQLPLRFLTMSLQAKKDALVGAQSMIDSIIDEKNCGPIFVRLAWHDSGTFDVNVKEEWPKAGGAVGSIRFEPEINHGANKGLANAVKLLEPVKAKYPDVSYADIFQMASARSIELASGPKIDMIYGRVDATSPEQCSPEGKACVLIGLTHARTGGDIVIPWAIAIFLHPLNLFVPHYRELARCRSCTDWNVWRTRRNCIHRRQYPVWSPS